MNGLLIRSNDGFGELFASVMDEFSQYYWSLDFNSGPFNYFGRDDWEEIDQQIDALTVNDPQWDEKMVGLGIWKPGLFPKFAPVLQRDEYNYFFGLKTSESDIVQAMLEIYSDGSFSDNFFKVLENSVGVFIAEIDHYWWEAYSSNQELMARIRQAHPLSEEIDSEKWNESK